MINEELTDVRNTIQTKLAGLVVTCLTCVGTGKRQWVLSGEILEAYEICGICNGTGTIASPLAVAIRGADTVECPGWEPHTSCRVTQQPFVESFAKHCRCKGTSRVLIPITLGDKVEMAHWYGRCRKLCLEPIEDDCRDRDGEAWAAWTEAWDAARNDEPPRSCVKCGKRATRKGHDPCIANLPGVNHACCGHGTKEAYVVFENGMRIEGKFYTKKEWSKQ